MAIISWSGWAFVAVCLSAAALWLIIRCCRKSKGDDGSAELKLPPPGGPGGGGNPLPIFGTVFDNTPTKSLGCSYHAGTDLPRVGETVSIFAANGGALVATLTTDANGQFGATVAQGQSYNVLLTLPAGFVMCGGGANPVNNVLVPNNGSVTVNFSIQKQP